MVSTEVVTGECWPQCVMTAYKSYRTEEDSVLCWIVSQIVRRSSVLSSAISTQRKQKGGFQNNSITSTSTISFNDCV